MRKPQRYVPRTDVPSPAQVITDAIVARLEAGTQPWRRPWTGAASQRPLRSCGTPYRGVNTFWLTLIADVRGFTSPYWMTYRQANALGGQVRRGERSTIAVFYKAYGKKVEDSATGEERLEGRRVLKSYPVFNASQIDGLPDRFFPRPIQLEKAAQSPARLAELQSFFDAIPSVVRYGGSEAYYAPGLDYIQMPEPDSFDSYEHFAATLGHEHAHWSGAENRLAREFGKRFGDDKYAAEELVAELTAAILGSELGLPVEHLENHASYIAGWLRILKADSRALLTLASKADEAASYLLAFSGRGPSGADEEEEHSEPANDADTVDQRVAA